MAVTLKDLIDNNDVSLQVLTQSLARLRQLRSQGPPPNQMALLSAQINTVQADISTAQMIDVHLKAATTTISPITLAEEAQLQNAAGQLDNVIKTNAIINASLAFVQDIMQDVEDVQQMSLQHT